MREFQVSRLKFQEEYPQFFQPEIWNLKLETWNLQRDPLGKRYPADSSLLGHIEQARLVLTVFHVSGPTFQERRLSEDLRET